MVREYEVTLTGMAPGLLMHRDNIEWADEMQTWRADPKNKGLSRPGDDRHPAFTWLGAVYHDGEYLALPADNIARCLMEGGAQTPVPGGRNGKTFKAQTQSGMMSRDAFWEFFSNGKRIPWASLAALMDRADVMAHRAVCRNLGFDLMFRRATIGKAKHVRVRPWFKLWSARGVISVWDDQITEAVLTTILAQCGSFKGLCDWRPGSKTPGPYGRFDAVVKAL